MPKDLKISTGDVGNLATGDVGGDQVGGNKFGGDHVAGNKVILGLHEMVFDPAVLEQLGLDASDRGIAEDLHRICQLVSKMIFTELKGNLSKPRGSLIGLPETRLALEKFHTLPFSATLDTSNPGSTLDLSNFPLLYTVNPNETFQFYRSMRNIRRRKGGDTRDFLRRARQFQAWSATSSSSILFVKGVYQSRHFLRDFATAVIESSTKRQIPITWILRPRRTDSCTLGVEDILKQLVFQIICQQLVSLDGRHAVLVLKRIQDASTVGNWLDIMGSVLEECKQIYFVIDTEIFDHQAQNYEWNRAFNRIFDGLQDRQVGALVKVAMFGCRRTIIRQFPDHSGARHNGAYVQSIERLGISAL